MANPVLPLIPWTGGWNRKQHPSLANPQQLVVVEDIVLGFDGSRIKRGGQSHRNRVRIPGGGFDDHFTASPPGDWTLTGTAISQPADSQWEIVTSSGDLTLTRSHSMAFTELLTIEVSLKWVSLDAAGYFEVYADTGSTASSKRLGIQFSGTGVKVYVSNSAALVSTVGTFPDIQFTEDMKELYDSSAFHTWTVTLNSDSQIEIYFDGHKVFVSNTVTNTLSAGAGEVKMTSDFVGATTDVILDYISIYDAGAPESVVTALYDFPRSAANGLETSHRVIAVVNGRVYEDPGTHKFDMILDKGSTDYQTLHTFVNFKSNLLIGRSRGLLIQRWIPGSVVEPLSDAPRAAFLQVHRNRVFAAGDPKHPSRLYWSGLLNDDDWTLEGSGTFLDSGFTDVDADDGGIITGLGPSFHGELIIYKTTGIFRLEGYDNNTFIMSEITKAIGGVGHHCIQNVGNDQYFVSPFGVHSLLTTDKFGAYEPAFLTFDIRKFWRDHVNPQLLTHAWAVNNEPEDRYELLLAVDEPHAGKFPTKMLSLHYALRDEMHQNGRWTLKNIPGGSVALIRDEGGKDWVFVGSTDGYVNRQDERYAHDFPVYYANPAL